MMFVELRFFPHAQKRPAGSTDAHADAPARPAAHRSTRSRYAFTAGDVTASRSTCGTFAEHEPEEEEEEESSSSSSSSSSRSVLARSLRLPAALRHSQFGSESHGVFSSISSHAVFAATSAPTPEAPTAVTAKGKGSGAQKPGTASPSASVSVHAHLFLLSFKQLSRRSSASFWLTVCATHAAAVASGALPSGQPLLEAVLLAGGAPAEDLPTALVAAGAAGELP